MFTYDIDAVAEREGEAVERLAELLGDDPPQTRRQVAIGQASAAQALGIEPERLPRYCRQAAVMAHLRMLDAFKQRKPHRIKFYWENANDRNRQAQRRLERANRLLTIRFASGDIFLSIPQAAKVSGMSERRISFWCQQGMVRAEREWDDMTPTHGNAWMVHLGSLREKMARKLHLVA